MAVHQQQQEQPCDVEKAVRNAFSPGSVLSWQDFSVSRVPWSISGNRLTQHRDRDQHQDHPAFVVQPRNHEEVQKVVSIARNASPGWTGGIAVLSGGHEAGNVTYYYAAGAILLDLSLMAGVSLDLKAQEMHVRGGCVTRQACQLLQGSEYIIPVGTGPGVGITGFALHGGVSGYTSKFCGLGAGKIVSMDVVMADGSSLFGLTAASDDDNLKSLFSSLRGAGGALGVVTKIKLALSELQSHILGGKLVFDLSSYSREQQRAALFKALLQAAHLRDNVHRRGPYFCLHPGCEWSAA
jgi:FAD/FMN-containing dehydrogenase